MKSNQENYNEQITNIIANFDWGKVRKTMVHLNCKWAYTVSEDRIPTIGDLVLQGTRLLTDLANSKESNLIATGGLEARKSNDTLSLSFVVTDWEATNGCN